MRKQKTTKKYAEEISDCIYDCKLDRKETCEYLETMLEEIVFDAELEPDFNLYSVFQRR